jgi:outer membrane protein assembly factor BamD (BamD/ComL family)
VDRRDVATLSVQEHYEAGVEALKVENWKEATAQFRVVSASFPDTPFGKEATYYLGVAYTRVKEYEFANENLNLYLHEHPNGKHFEKCLEYKLHIADAFRQGARRHLFGLERLPKWLPAHKTALSIYDEVIDLAPAHSLAAKALYTKSQFLVSLRRYVEAVDAAQTFIHRFPKHELLPDAFLAISDAYLRHCEEERNNPDLLPLAKINLKRFKLQLPREDKTSIAEERLQEMREVYASGLFETGKFYEKIGKPSASVIYYLTALRKFPETNVAGDCKDRLVDLQDVAEELQFSKELWL